MAASTIGALSVMIKGNTNPLAKSMGTAKKLMEKFRKSMPKDFGSKAFKGITKGLKDLQKQSMKTARVMKDQLGGALKEVKGLASSSFGKFAAIVGGVSLGGLVAQTSAHAKEITRWSSRLGVANSTMAELSLLGSRFGAETEDVADVFKEIALKSTDAANGATSYQEVFKMLNIDFMAFSKLKPEDQFKQFSQALSQSTKEIQKFALDELVSDPGIRMIEVLTLSNEELERQRKNLRDTGRVMSELDFATVTIGNQKFKSLTESITAFGNQLTVAIIPAIHAIGEAFGFSGTQALNFTKIAQRAAEVVVNAVGFVKDMANLAGAGFKGMFAILAKGAPMAVEMIRYIAKTFMRFVDMFNLFDTQELVDKLIDPLEEMAGEMAKKSDKMLMEAGKTAEAALNLKATEAMQNQLAKSRDAVDEMAKMLMTRQAEMNAASGKLLGDDVLTQDAKKKSLEGLVALAQRVENELKTPYDKVLDLQAKVYAAVNAGKLDRGVAEQYVMKIWDDYEKGVDKGLKSFVDGLDNKFKSPLQKLNEEIMMLEDALNKGIISDAKFDELEAKLRKSYEDGISKAETETKKIGQFAQINLAEIDPQALARKDMDVAKKSNKFLEEIKKSNQEIAEKVGGSSSAQFSA